MTDNPQVAENQQVSTTPTDVVGMLSDEYKALPSAKKFEGKDVNALFSSYVNLEKEFGKRAEGVKIPSDNAPAEEWQAFYAKLGVPESPDKYTPIELGEGVAKDENLENWFKQTAHQSGLTPKQFENLYKNFYDFQMQQVEAHANKTKELFGDKYEQAVKQSERLLAELPESLQEQVKPFVGFDPVVTSLLAEISSQLFGESVSPEGGTSPAASNDTLKQLEAEYEKVTSINNKSYWNGNPKEVEKALNLLEKIQLIQSKMA